MYKNPISLIQGLLGAKLWWCPLCRIQFYDCRPPATSRLREQASTTPLGTGTK